MSADQRRLAHAFAEYVVTRTAASSEALAGRLAETGETTRVDLLRAFARSGDHIAPAPWWAPDTRCHVSLGLPEDPRVGDLWFDPLEVSIALVEPWARPAGRDVTGKPKFYGWVSIDTVTSWQLRGAHEVKSYIPASGELITGDQAESYCNLFSKSLAGTADWLFLKDVYGMDTVARIWGDAEEQQFGTGGSISGSIEWISLAELREWQPHEDYDYREGSDLLEAGLAFRGSANYQQDLWTGHGALPRTWNS